MKTIFLSVFLLFLAVGLSAQKFEYKRTKSSVSVSNENFELLLAPYMDKGVSTPYEIKDIMKIKEWKQQIRNHVLSGNMAEKFDIKPKSLGFTFYFNVEGKMIDVTLYISFSVYDKLTEEDIRNIYNRMMQNKIDMNNLSWTGDFNYCFYTSFLESENPYK